MSRTYRYTDKFPGKKGKKDSKRRRVKRRPRLYMKGLDTGCFMGGDIDPNICASCNQYGRCIFTRR